MSSRFLNCKINISGKIFRPRTETEFWVKSVIQTLKHTEERPLYVLDIFSGSGCIGIAILKNIKNSRVDFADIARTAVEQIKINLQLNNISPQRYSIYRSNLFKELRGGRYDVIFANPPYVALSRISEVQKEVLGKDPHLALFAGKDGLVYIENFFKQVKKYLKPKGKIFLEFDPLQKRKIREVLEKGKFKFIFKKDQFGKYRWLKAEKKN